MVTGKITLAIDLRISSIRTLHGLVEMRIGYVITLPIRRGIYCNALGCSIIICHVAKQPPKFVSGVSVLHCVTATGAVAIAKLVKRFNFKAGYFAGFRT